MHAVSCHVHAADASTPNPTASISVKRNRCAGGELQYVAEHSAQEDVLSGAVSATVGENREFPFYLGSLWWRFRKPAPFLPIQLPSPKSLVTDSCRDEPVCVTLCAGTCDDKTAPDGSEWNDGRGVEHNCAWFAGSQSSVGAPAPYTYVGCFTDNVGGVRDLVTWPEPANQVSQGWLWLQEEEKYTEARIMLCANACKSEGWTYMGLQWQAECWCGNTYGSQGELDISRCDSTGDVSDAAGTGGLVGVADKCGVGDLYECDSINAIYSLEPPPDGCGDGYAQSCCDKHGAEVANNDFGYTPNTACCTCGGGDPGDSQSRLIFCIRHYSLSRSHNRRHNR